MRLLLIISMVVLSGCLETVKVGDKFGLRITSRLLPEERFLSLAGLLADGQQPDA